MTETTRRDEMMTFLQDEGYRPELDDDGDITFNYEGDRYYIEFDANDEEYLKINLVVGKFEPEELEAVLEGANAASLTVKAAKVVILENLAFSTVELFVARIADLKPVFRRYLACVQGAAGTASDEAKERKKG